MKKRILSILLLCCMVLTMLPTTAFAAGELPDVKLSVPTTFDKTVDLTKQNKELKIKDSKTYLIKGSADPNWYFQYRIKIDGKNNTPHIFLDGVRLQAPKDGPAIELYGGASACLYFIGGGQRADRRGELRRTAEKQNRWLSPGSGADGDKAHV